MFILYYFVQRSDEEFHDKDKAIIFQSYQESGLIYEMKPKFASSVTIEPTLTLF